MPKGVICGGAVDGSNQLGEMVTNHAITARPDGAAVVERGAPKAAIATNSKQVKARCMRSIWNDIMRTPRAANFWRLERLEDYGSRPRWRQLRSWHFAGVSDR